MDNVTERAMSPAIADALRKVFGSDQVEHIAPLGNGLSSAELYKFSMGGRGYVIRHVKTHAPPVDPHREFACMITAAERGIAPRVVFADSDGGICISDLIPGQTLSDFLRNGGGSDVIEAIAQLVRKLHEGPAFPQLMARGEPMTIPSACASLLATLRSSGASSDFLRDVEAPLNAIRDALLPHTTVAPCHYDLNPGNILIEGTRLWLVDWELACAGDPFQDLASLEVFAFRSPIARQRLIRAYLDREPTEIELARLAASRALSFIFYSLLFVTLSRRPPATGEGAKTSPVGDIGLFARQISADALTELRSEAHANALETLKKSV